MTAMSGFRKPIAFALTCSVGIKLKVNEDNLCMYADVHVPLTNFLSKQIKPTLINCGHLFPSHSNQVK